MSNFPNRQECEAADRPIIDRAIAAGDIDTLKFFAGLAGRRNWCACMGPKADDCPCIWRQKMVAERLNIEALKRGAIKPLEWQPIATAPKDRLVDLWCEHRDPAFPSDQPRMLTGFWSDGDDEWNVYAAHDALGAYRLSRLDMKATHWKPHAEPPPLQS